MLALVAVAFLLRLGWGLAAGVTPGSFDDAGWYHQTAITLANGGGYRSPFTGQPTASWPPGYPFVLSLGYRVLGAAPSTAVVLNAIFGALTCVFVWRLACRLAGASVAPVATALLAAFPSHVFFAALVLSETLFTCLVVGLMLAAVRLVQRADDRAWLWLLWGAGVGAAALVRAESAVLALVPAAALLTLRRRGALRVGAVALVGLALALAPWTLRNARVFGTFVPTSNGFGRTLWIGHHPGAHGGMSQAIQAEMQRAIEATGLPPTPAGEVALDRALRAQAIDFMLTHPLRELALTPARAYHLFRGDHVWQAWYGPGTPRVLPSPGARRALGVVGNLYYLAVGCLALAGFALRDRAGAAGWRVVDLWMLAWVALFTVIYGDPRFHHVLVPPACILAAVTLARLTGGREPHDAAVAGA